MCDEFETEGCQDDSACNFDDSATDAGDCSYADAGYDCDGNCLADEDGDGVCDEFETEGCQDDSACNFDDSATDSGDCSYADAGYDCAGTCLEDADGDGVCDEFEVLGCQDDSACNFDASATDSGDCSYADAGYDCDGTCLADDDGDGVCNEFEIGGCTDASACNYDASATDDDGSCVFANDVCESCLDGGVLLSDADGDGICDTDEISGCQDETACNFNPNATDPCENDIQNNYAISFDGVDDFIDLGVFWNNYQSFSINLKVKFDEFGWQAQNGQTVESIIVGSSDTDSNWNGFNLYANPQGQFIFNVGGNGTTTAIVSDPQQEDVWYNVTATLDQQLDLIRLYINGLLIGESDIENIGTISNTYPLYAGGVVVDDAGYFAGSIDDFSIWNKVLEQDEINNLYCTSLNGDEDDLLSFWNYEEPNESTALDLSVNNYIGIISGAIYSNSVSEQNCDTSCCNYVPEGEDCAGCTNENACNYNPTVVEDDGSCLTIYGCTDPNACPDSYNPNAQCDDGSCTYLTTWYIDNDGMGLDLMDLGYSSIESCDEMDGYADNNDDENDGDFDNDGISGTEFNGDDCDDTTMQVLALQKLVMIVQETAYKMKTMMEFAMILKLKAVQMHLRVIIMI